MKKVVIASLITILLAGTASYFVFSRYFFGFRDTSRFFCQLAYVQTSINQTETMLDSNLYTGETRIVRESKPGRERKCLFGRIREDVKPTSRLVAHGTKSRPRDDKLTSSQSTPQNVAPVQHYVPQKEPELNCHTVPVPKPAKPKIIYDNSLPEGEKRQFNGRDGVIFRCDGFEDVLMNEAFPDEITIGIRKPDPDKSETRPKRPRQSDPRTGTCSACYRIPANSSAYQMCMIACRQ